VQDWQSNYHEMELSYVFASPFTGVGIDSGAPEGNTGVGIDSGAPEGNTGVGIDSGAPEGYADVDQRLSRLIMRLWTNFAKYG